MSLFTRASISPGDRSPVDRYIDGGLVAVGLISGRPDDRLGLGFIHAKFSDQLAGARRDVGTFGGAPQPIPDHETNFELTWQAQIVPGWTVQPNLQYVLHPSGDWTKNAVVVGPRTLIRS